MAAGDHKPGPDGAMTTEPISYEIRLARDGADLRAAQRLRYEVFVEELGADGPGVDRLNRLETDEFDPVSDHLLLIDPTRDPAAENHVGAVYRLLDSEREATFGRYYCDAEYDLGPLRASGRHLLELGRSCVRADLRGGVAMPLLWAALADYVLDRGVEVMFGVASFHGTDAGALAMPLSWLHCHHLAPAGMRPQARAPGRLEMDLVPESALDKRQAMAAMPNLIRAYLRLGGFVGEGAFVDRAFNTTDVLLLMDTERMSARHLEFYSRRHEARS